jgi:excinuclease UvrABC ATPase subunit
MRHHFRVLTVNELWDAVRVAQATFQVLMTQYARPAAMKRGVMVYTQVQACTKALVDMILAGTDSTKPVIIALGRNYKGTRACLRDKWMPVCKAVQDGLKRHFSVVLINEYLTLQMCHDCHNKMVARKGDRRSSRKILQPLWL